MPVNLLKWRSCSEQQNALDTIWATGKKLVLLSIFSWVSLYLTLSWKTKSLFCPYFPVANYYWLASTPTCSNLQNMNSSANTELSGILKQNLPNRSLVSILNEWHASLFLNLVLRVAIYSVSVLILFYFQCSRFTVFLHLQNISALFTWSSQKSHDFIPSSFYKSGN